MIVKLLRRLREMMLGGDGCGCGEEATENGRKPEGEGGGELGEEIANFICKVL